jgi:hypothetical protein
MSVTIVQQRTHSSSTDATTFLPSAPTIGNTLVWAAGVRDEGDMAPLVAGEGWTKVVGVEQHAGHGDSAAIFSRTVRSGDTASVCGSTSLTWSALGRGVVYELQGAVTVVHSTTGGPVDPDAADPIPVTISAVSATAGSLVIAVWKVGVWDVDPGAVSTPGAGWTADCDANQGGAAPSPHVLVLRQAVSSAGSYTPSASVDVTHTFAPDDTNTWEGVAVAFTSGTPVDHDDPLAVACCKTPFSSDATWRGHLRLKGPVGAGSVTVYEDGSGDVVATRSWTGSEATAGIAETFDFGVQGLIGVSFRAVWNHIPVTVMEMPWTSAKLAAGQVIRHISLREPHTR